MAIVTNLGRIEEFRPQDGNISSYFERVKQFFAANKVPEAKKIPVLLSCLGAKVYEVLKNLLTSDAPSTKSSADLAAAPWVFRWKWKR